LAKKVPLVVYDEQGNRNEIGTAEVEVWPGEVRVKGLVDDAEIVGTIPIFSNFRGMFDGE
jgi:hypothetical protein